MAMKTIEHPDVGEREAMGKQAAGGRLRRVTRGGARPRIALTRLPCWRRRTSPGSRTWCRSATAG